MRKLVALWITGMIWLVGACGEDDLDVSTTSQELVSHSPGTGTIAFGDVRVGQTSPIQYAYALESTQSGASVIGVSNTCSGSGIGLTYFRVVYDPSTGNETYSSPSFPFTINTNSITGVETYLEVRYTFSPSARGNLGTCTSFVNTSGIDATYTFTGRGVAPVLAVNTPSTGTLAFGGKRINQQTSPSDLILQNANTGDPAVQTLTITSMPLSANSDDWVVNFNTATSIAVGATRTGTVTFAPKTVGPQDATMTINSNDPVDPDETVTLTGIGLTATSGVSASSLAIPSAGATIIVNQSQNATVNLINTTTAANHGTTLTVNAISFSGTNAADFSLVGTPPSTVAAGSFATLTVKCRPTAVGARTATMTIDTDADNIPQDPTVTLSCTGVKPDISVAPSPMTFSTPVAPGSSANLTLVISNASGTNSTTLTVSSLTMGGTNPGDFSFSGVTPPFNVAAGGTQNVTITFSPQALGSRSAQLTINSNDVETPAVTVNLSGTGQAPEITMTTPTSAQLDFGGVTVGTQSLTQPVTVRNDGNINLSITSAFIGGDDPDQFFFTGPSSTTLTPNSTATWNVGCQPSSTSSPSATFTIQSNDPDETFTLVDLVCQGVQGVLALRSPSAPVDFGEVRINDASAVYVTVWNVGNDKVNVSDVRITTSDFIIIEEDHTVPYTLEQEGTATYGIRFVPTTAGAKDADLEFDYNGTTFAVPLTGLATSAIVSPSTNSLTYGKVVLGQTSVLGFDISNTGTAPLTVNNVSLGGADSTNFFQSSGPSFPLTLGPAGSANASTHVDFACSPFAPVGTKSATVTISTDADNSPQNPTVSLSCIASKPDITVSPSPVAFGNVTPGTPTPTTVTISNANNASTTPLTVNGISLSGSSTFTLGTLPTMPFTLQPGTQQQFTITFTPSAAGNFTSTLTVNSDDQETSSTVVSVTGTGNAPEIQLNTPASGSLAFGDIPVTAGESAGQTVTIQNTGTASLTLTSVSLVGTNPGEFTITGTRPPPNMTVTSGSTASWTIACDPSSTGAKTATLRIVSNDSDEPNTDVGLTCNGTAGSLVVFSPSTPIAFGTAQVGGTPVDVVVTLRNTGGAALTINSASISGPFSIQTGFSLGTPPFSLPASTNTTLTLRFTPTADGSANGTFGVTYDTTNTMSVGLNGTGQAALVSSNVSSLPLGNVLVGSTTTTGTITLSNAGSATLNVTSFSSTNTTDFDLTSPTFPFTVTPGGSTNITARCKPQSVGSKSTNLTFDTDADNAPQDPVVTVTCTGVKPDITVSPLTVPFGAQAPGSQTQLTTTVSNANNATTSNLTVTSLVLGGSQPGDYSISPSTGFTLAPNASQVITVTFTPGALGARDATLTVNSTDQETPAVPVTLTGSGQAPELTMTAPATGSIAFGNVKIGTTTTSSPVTIQNDGNTTLSITSVSLIGTNAGDFGFSGTTVPANLAASATGTWNVTCTPTATGGRTATLRILSNDANEGTVDVPLSCTGTQGQLVVDTPAVPIQMGTLDVGATSTEVTVTVKNVGTASMQITGATVDAPFTISTAFAQTPPFSLAAGATATLGLKFAPTADGLATGTLTVANEVSALNAEVRGTGEAALVAVAPTSVSFGNVLVGSTAVTTTFALQNTGSDTMAFSGTSLGGTNPGDFVVVSPATPTTVPAAGSVTVTVRCTPTAAGARTATLTVDTDADNTPQDPGVPLSCNGVKPDITVAPTTVTFTGGTPGVPQQQDILVSNASGSTAATLSVSALAISGTNQADYSVAPSGAFTLAPGATRTLTITFTPGGFGSRTASLTLTSDDQETGLVVVDLVGQGSAPEISVTPVGATIALGNVNVGATGTVTNVVVTSAGNEDLDVTGVQVVGAQASQFLVSGPSTPLTIVPSNTGTWQVSCKPTSAGAKTASLQILSNDADETTTSYNLTCNGTVALLARTSPAGSPVTFASTRMGESSSEVTIILENTGDGPLTINGAVTSPAEFTISTPFTQTPPFTLAPGANATLGVRFTPSATGDLDGMLDINWDATSLSVPLRGPGRVAEASITPIANPDGIVDLGAACVGSPRTVAVKVTNIGSAPFEVLSAATTGDAFSVSTVTTTSLSPGNFMTMDLTIDAVLGDQTGTLAITTDIPNDAVHTLDLQASGIESGLGVVPAMIEFPSTLPGDVSPRIPVTVTNCEAGSMSIAQVALQGDDAGDFGIVAGTIPPPALAIAESESATWQVEFHPDTEGGSDATLHLSHDLAVGGGVIDIPVYGFGGTGSPDAGPGPDAEPSPPDAEDSPDAEDPALDRHSYYACSTGAPSPATLLLLVGAIAFVMRRRRRS